ncbi:MAG: HD domain-containing protein [Rhodoferax sp.]|nr:YfbR-like 5'-deoxynucleotidase [Rhodoferax sp.]MDP3651076.1 HD domain-containing protein [Rhodoferax sp.]
MTQLFTSAARELQLAGPGAQHADNVPGIREIAHSLSYVNRFTGHASRGYSVAEHSLLVMMIARNVFGASPAAQLAALMHDAHECITGDTTSPVKQVLGSAWAQFEAIHEHAVRKSYGLLGVFEQHGAMIKKCDLIALATERRDLLPYVHHWHTPWPVLDAPGAKVLAWNDVNLQTPPPFDMVSTFEDAALELMDQAKYELCVAITSQADSERTARIRGK